MEWTALVAKLQRRGCLPSAAAKLTDSLRAKALAGDYEPEFARAVRLPSLVLEDQAA